MRATNGSQPFGPGDVEVVSEETIFKGFFRLSRFTLKHRLFRGGWSAVFQRELMRRRDAAGVLLFDPVLDAVALVEQFRVGAYARGETRPWLFEIVAGVIDKDETPAEVAVREAQEEAGCTVTALEPIARYMSSPGGSDEYFDLFCGRADLSQAGGVHGLAEENEDIRVHVMPVADFFGSLERNEISNSMTLVAALWLRLHHARMVQQWR